MTQDMQKPRARLMDDLSGGVCLKVLTDLLGFEWRQHIALTILGRAKAETPVYPFTKVGFWAGEQIIGESLLPESSSARGKLLIDTRWGMTMEDCQSVPGFSRAPNSFAQAFVAAAAEGRLRALEKKAPFRGLVKRERLYIFHAMKEEFFDTLAKMCPPTRGSDAGNVATLIDGLVEKPNPWTMASLQVFAGASAAMTAKGQITVPNDLIDMLQGTIAIPYCDAYFCDKAMAGLWCGKPLEYDKVYGTTIGHKPEEIVAYLDGIS